MKICIVFCSFFLMSLCCATIDDRGDHPERFEQVIENIEVQQQQILEEQEPQVEPDEEERIDEDTEGLRKTLDEQFSDTDLMLDTDLDLPVFERADGFIIASF